MGESKRGESKRESDIPPKPGSEVQANLALAREAAGGNATATAKLVRALAPRLARVVTAILGAGHAELDDAIQHALIGLVQALPAFRGDCDPLGYATIIAVRSAILARKRTRLHRARHDEIADAEALAASRPSPGEEADALLRKETLRELLAELPPEQAEALAMRVVLGWSMDEIAIYSTAPKNTVRSRLRLAKEALRRRIEADAGLADALRGLP